MQTKEPLTSPPVAGHPLFWLVERADRPRLCADLVAIPGPTLIRARTAEAAAAVADQLCRRGVPALHYGVGRSHPTARRDFRRFVEGNVPVLVISGGLADLRFLRSGSVQCLINYDPADLRLPVGRSSALIVTLVVREREPELPASVAPTEPDLALAREILAGTAASAPTGVSRRMLRSRLAQIPGLVDRVRGRLTRTPHHAERVAPGS